VRPSLFLPSRRAARLGVLAIAAGSALPVTAMLATPALAGPSPTPKCTVSGDLTTCVFAKAQSYTWAVPAGVTSIGVVADGAAGRSGNSLFPGAGGAGGEFSATLTSIPPSTSLIVFPGAKGQRTQGGTGGGAGGNGTSAVLGHKSGGGGGASVVAVTSLTAGNVLVAAGGGGGGGAGLIAGYGGNGGGSSAAGGGNGSGLSATFGLGATVGAGGAAAASASGCTTAPRAGLALQGGNSGTGSCATAGGGGGGGYYGGGGGVLEGGGGGGSAFPASAVTRGGILVTPTANSGTNDGRGKVSITYTAADPTSLTAYAGINAAHTLTLSAKLTTPGVDLGSRRNGALARPLTPPEPVAGEIITFWTHSSYLCTSYTGGGGTASCVLNHAQTALVRSHTNQFTAVFAGSGDYLPSKAYGTAPAG